MNLVESIDILIDVVYNQKKSNQSISNIFESKGIDHDYLRSHIICEKVDELSIFRTINTSSSSGADRILYSNPRGLAFVDKFKTYSKFLNQQKIEEEFEQNKIKEKEQRELEAHEANLTASKAAVSSKKSSWTSSIIAAIATLFAIIQYFKSNEINDKYDKAIVQIDSLKQDLKEMKIHKQSLTDSSKIKPKKK